jgi:hypothetical protein
MGKRILIAMGIFASLLSVAVAIPGIATFYTNYVREFSDKWCFSTLGFLNRTVFMFYNDEYFAYEYLPIRSNLSHKIDIEKIQFLFLEF